MIPRWLAAPLLAALQDTRVVLLHGARQTGKSTLARWLASHDYPARYLTLDDAAVLSAARQDPAGFVAGFETPVVLDEVQRSPELFLALKAEVDRDPRPGRFLLTGSANVLTLPRLADSLAGRMEILTLWPLSQGELAGTRENFLDAAFAPRLPALTDTEPRAALLSRILTGGYPAVLSRATEERRQAWFGGYVTTILQRDIRDLAHIEGLAELPRLLSLLAGRAASLLNFAELSRTAAIPQSTLKRYMALLETTFLVQFLPAWSANLGKRLVKAPKLILNDSGLAAYLLGLSHERLVQDSTRLGPLLENFVVMELRKQAAWSRTRPQLFHFRQQTGLEVDILLEDAAGRLVGIEVKAGATVGTADFKGLRALAEATGERFQRGIVLYLGPESVPFGANLAAFPVGTLWRPAS